jgi:hypothetical protein
MAFTALYNGKERGAWSVPKNESASCTECGEEMRVVSESSDGRARHFRHHRPEKLAGGGGDGDSNCGGGESDDHKKWKNFAAERLNEVFGNCNIDRATVEEPLAAPWSDKEGRAADACVFFEDWDDQFGRGLAIEVQHKHKDKDKHAVEMDYNRQDVAVLWLSGDDFHDDGLRMREVDIRHRTREQTSICDLAEKWARVDVAGKASYYDEKHRPITHESLILRVEAPHGWETSIEATFPRDWFIPTPREYWERQEWQARFQTVCDAYIKEYDRGSDTRIPVKIPSSVDTERIKRDSSKYRCADCRWKGDKYSVASDGTVGGTAVCPDCGGGLRLNSSHARKVQRRVRTD